MKNLKINFGVILLLCLFGMSTQAENVFPSKNYKTREIKGVTAFNSITNLASADVKYRQNKGSETKVAVYGPENLIDLLDIQTVNGELKISFKKNISINGPHILEVITTSPFLNEVTLQSSGDLDLEGTIKGSSLKLNINASGDIEADNLKYNNFQIQIQGSGDATFNRLEGKDAQLQVKGSGDIDIYTLKLTEVFVNVQGSGDVELNGSARKAILKSGGSGDISAKELTAENVTAIVTGSGEISCHATKNLDAQVLGSGDIKYKDNPSKITKQGKTDQIYRK